MNKRNSETQRKKPVMLNGVTIDLLEKLQDEYLLKTETKITVNNLVRKLLMKATLKDIL